jgi:hypothetical protein
LLRGEFSWEVFEHIQLVTFIVLTVAFMLVLLRLIYLLILKIPHSRLQNVWLIRAPFTILFPLLCLLVYNGVIGVGESAEVIAELQLFGDWSHPAYYVLAFINGVLLTLPPSRRDVVRIGVFVAKGMLYPFVAYFFIVFLPFFPFAISAVVFLGLGLLLLAPLLLFFFQTWSLFDDGRALGARFGRRFSLVVFLLSVAVMPIGITVMYSMDRGTLNAMLTHVYEPDYSLMSKLDLDPDSVRRVLGNIRNSKAREDFGSGERTPYLTTYYQWLVLDNLTLSDSRLSDLERIFLGNTASRENTTARTTSNSFGPGLTKVSTTTKYSDDGSYYISTVDLTLTNGDIEGGEYATRFRLPLGAWIRDYYLYIDGKKVPGMLAEKKSAMWVYQQIRDTRRDPGIIYYTSPDELILRVFPFAQGEVRKTGFEIIHREPMMFKIDGRQIDLQAKQPLTSIQNGEGDENFLLLSPAVKATLRKYTRRPYLHFIIDRSSTAAQDLDAYGRRIDSLVKNRPLNGMDMTGAKITVANYVDETFPLDNEWYAKARQLEAAGGFFLERTVKKALYANYREHATTYPIFIVVSDHIDDAIYTDGMQDFEMTMPEGDLFLVMDRGNGISAQSFITPVVETQLKELFSAPRHVLAWPDATNPVAFLRDDNQPGLVIKNIDKDVIGQIGEDNAWNHGLNLYGMWMTSRLNPRDAELKQYSIISNSFETHLMTPLTAFISLENDAQRQALLKKQQQMLASLRPLDVGEEHQMDEPPLWLLMLILIAMTLLMKRRKSGRKTGSEIAM